MASHQHFVTVHVANVQGAGAPLYLAGARVLAGSPSFPCRAT
jgi:hypothetical protein